MKLYLDACVIIYCQELAEPFYNKFIDAMNKIVAEFPDASLATSRLSILECCVRPYKSKDRALLEKYEEFFNHPDLSIIEISADVISKATQLRANDQLTTPDAIQAASAMLTDNMAAFITNDKQFKKLLDLPVILI